MTANSATLARAVGRRRSSAAMPQRSAGRGESVFRVRSRYSPLLDASQRFSSAAHLSPLVGGRSERGLLAAPPRNK
jgi:hypothetical protein